jgi:hypothetical protein
MAVSIKDILDGNSINIKHDSCAKCGQPINFLTGRNHGPEGDLCDDCYFEDLGDGIDPIGM